MGCNCGGKVIMPKTNAQQNIPSITNGTNQILLKQLADQARQQAAIQAIINPQRTVIKTYH
jgi:hypothetical protein